MKDLLNTKRADLYLQLLALVIPFVWAIAVREEVTIFYAYFTVGSIQIISFLINTWQLDNRVKSIKRVAYGKWLATVIIVFFCLLLPCLAGIEIAYGAMMIFAFLMLFIGAGLAFFYFSITAEELTTIRKLANRSKHKAFTNVP
jgi:hypothetical protein